MDFLRILIFLGALCVNTINGLNILQICPGFSQSHVIFNHKLAATLHRAGHNVTILNMIMMPNLGNQKTPKGVTEIRIQPDYSKEMVQLIMDTMQDYVFKPTTHDQMTKLTVVFRDLAAFLCQHVLNQTDLLAQLDKTFDVTLSHMFNLCPLGVSRLLHVPKFIWVAPGTFIMDHVANIMALPNIISYTPYSGADYSDRMSFVSRTKNLFWITFTTYLTKSKWYTFAHENQHFKRFPNEKQPDLWTLAEDTQALLVNGEDFLDFPRPLFPGLLHIGELQHKDAGNLPEVWQNIMDNSNKGVILFSLGTIANTSLMQMELKNAFLDAFSNFSDYSIIWRLEGEMPRGLEEQTHIKIVTWTPQKELLNHPKFKLFITHGGYNSLLETAQAGVPMILMPLFNDQYPNAHRAVRHGLGLMLDKFNTDSVVIKKTIASVLYDEKYRENAKKFSTILQDKFIPNDVSMVKFIEKVVYTKRWPTMKSAQRLSFFQYYCLDVLLFLILIFASVFYFVFKTFVFGVQIFKRLR